MTPPGLNTLDITVTQGSILDAETQAIVNAANSLGIMATGEERVSACSGRVGAIVASPG